MMIMHHTPSLLFNDSFYIDEFYPVQEDKHPRVLQGFDVNNPDARFDDETNGEGEYDPFADFEDDTEDYVIDRTEQEEVEVDGSKLREDIENIVGTAPWVDAAFNYSSYAGNFLWELNAASVGKVSGNLSVCQGNLTVFYGGASVIYDEYAEQLYAQAGRSTYDILRSIDPIIFSCYFSLFEYVIAFTIYQETA